MTAYTSFLYTIIFWSQTGWRLSNQFNEYEAQARTYFSCSCKKAFLMVEELQHLSWKDSDL